MFRPFLGHPQALWENRSKSCLCFTVMWDPMNTSWICFLGGPQDDLIKFETCRPDKYTIFIVYKIKCCVID